VDQLLEMTVTLKAAPVMIQINFLIPFGIDNETVYVNCLMILDFKIKKIKCHTYVESLKEIVVWRWKNCNCIDF
jgi:hypothetical protein